MSRRLVALDHQHSDIYLVTLEDTSDGGSKKKAADWRQERMQGIQKALTSCEPEHLLCNGSAATPPVANSNEIHSTTYAGSAAQQSRPDAVLNGCSHAVLADSETLQERPQVPSNIQVMWLT